MTPAETPTECATPRPRERVLGPNRHTCKEVNEKDARIRELEATLRFIATEWDLKPSIKELRSRAKAALARSEEKP